MSYSRIIDDIKLNDITLGETLLPRHNPYVGTFPWYWHLMHIEPKTKEASTQTDDDKYFLLGQMMAKKYGKGWESLLSG